MMMSEMRSQYFLVIFAVMIGAVRSIGLNSCESSPSFKIKSLDLSPAEIHPGQDVTVSAQWDVVGDVSKPIKADFKFFKTVGFAGFSARIQLPCQNNVGSCTYNDICRMAPGEFCNFSRGPHNASGLRIKVPAAKNVAGTYDMEVRLTDGSGRKLGCWSGKLTVK